MERHFHQRPDAIKQELEKMADAAEESFYQATRALVERGDDLEWISDQTSSIAENVCYWVQDRIVCLRKEKWGNENAPLGGHVW